MEGHQKGQLFIENLKVAVVFVGIFLLKGQTFEVFFGGCHFLKLRCDGFRISFMVRIWGENSHLLGVPTDSNFFLWEELGFTSAPAPKKNKHNFSFLRRDLEETFRRLDEDGSGQVHSPW